MILDNPQRKIMPKEYSDKLDPFFDKWMNSGMGDALDWCYIIIKNNRMLKEAKENKK